MLAVRDCRRSTFACIVCFLVRLLNELYDYVLSTGCYFEFLKLVKVDSTLLSGGVISFGNDTANCWKLSLSLRLEFLLYCSLPLCLMLFCSHYSTLLRKMQMKTAQLLHSLVAHLFCALLLGFSYLFFGFCIVLRYPCISSQHIKRFLVLSYHLYDLPRKSSSSGETLFNDVCSTVWKIRAYFWYISLYSFNFFKHEMLTTIMIQIFSTNSLIWDIVPRFCVEIVVFGPVFYF